MMKGTQNSPCVLCGLDQHSHDGVEIIHAFTLDDSVLAAQPPADPPPEDKAFLLVDGDVKPGTPVIVPLTTDPLLRALLISKGIITVAELDMLTDSYMRNGYVIVDERSTPSSTETAPQE